MFFENRPVASFIKKTVHRSNSHNDGNNRRTRKAINPVFVLKIIIIIFRIITSWHEIVDQTSIAIEIRIEVTSHTICAFKHVKSTASEFTLAIHLQCINETTEISPRKKDTIENLPPPKPSSNTDTDTNTFF